jgi:hypothetical protein
MRNHIAAKTTTARDLGWLDSTSADAKLTDIGALLLDVLRVVETQTTEITRLKRDVDDLERAIRNLQR